MRNRADSLFCTYDLHSVLESNSRNVSKEVDNIPESNIISGSDQELVEYIYSRVEILPLEIYEDVKEMEQQETQVDVRYDTNRMILNSSQPCLVPGVMVVVTIPFSGESKLWNCQPSTYTLSPPHASIRVSSTEEYSGYVDIVCTYPTDSLGDGSSMKQDIERVINDIRRCVESIKRDVEAHNKALRNAISQCIQARRQRLSKHDQIAKLLNIPLKQKSGAPSIEKLPIQRKLVRPLPKEKNMSPEPGIQDTDYEHILKVIRHEGRTFETTPRTFAVHDEEGLRDIILAHLNGHYEGLASGETFRNNGKTDIRIEDQSRAAFIAECKIWRGQKELQEAVDQLIGYLTWRDCKGAMIIFNKNVAGFSELQTKVPETLRQHPNMFEEKKVQQLGEWRFVCRSLEDAARYIIIHVFLFNVFVGKK